ncbi:MAG: ankyrin repeat domain-containing protein [Pleurocapsa sp.]
MSWVILDFVEKLANYPQEQELRLAEAVANDDVTEIKKLLRQGVDPNVRIVGQCLNPLIFLAFQKNFFTLPPTSPYDVQQNLYEIIPKTECLRCLLEYGADPNLRNNFGKTVLDLAIIWCLPDTVKLLLEYGADVNLGDRQGITPLMKTVIWGIQDARSMADKLQISQYILDFGADINAQTLDGTTALMYAVTNCRIKAIEFLLAKGASLSITDNRKNRAWDLIPKHLNRDCYEGISKMLTQPQFQSDLPINPTIEPEGDRLLKVILSALQETENNQ